MSKRQLLALRLRQVQERVPLSRAQIYRLIAEGDFPAPFRLSARTSAWDADEISEWLQQRRGHSAVRSAA
jgi:prophage regulatory protein